MNPSPLARSVSLAIICLLVGPALGQTSDAPLPQPDPSADPVATQVVEADTTRPEDESTSIGIDRSTWPVIRISPADGTVTHHLAFMGESPLGEDEVSPLHAPDPVWQIQEALAGASAGNYNSENFADLGTQPIIALAQFIALPFRMILDNPFSETTSP